MEKILIMLIVAATLFIQLGNTYKDNVSVIDDSNIEIPKIEDKKEKDIIYLDKVEVIDIIDTSERDGLSLPDALEPFYCDNKYEYYFSNIKSNCIIVKYSDGSEKKMKEALKDKDITIEDLRKYKIGFLTRELLSE